MYKLQVHVISPLWLVRQYCICIAHMIILVPTKANPNLNDALNDVFNKTDTDIMTDVEISTWSWWIPYIYGQTGWKVQGTAIKTRSN